MRATYVTVIAGAIDEGSEASTIHNTWRLAITHRVNVTRTIVRSHSADDLIEVEIGVLGLDDGSFEEFVHFDCR